MTENEKRLAGEIYDPMDEEVQALQTANLAIMDAFNGTTSQEGEKRKSLLKDMLGSCGEGCWIEPPFRANWGGSNIHFGSKVYANFNLTAVDDVSITVGDYVMFGPNVTIATANHPMDPEQRRRGLQYAKPVVIGENVWIGAGAMILPGVTIGENAVIGAGSVVNRDIPANAFAAGNPCRVIRSNV